jgi:hypothetical protein
MGCGGRKLPFDWELMLAVLSVFSFSGWADQMLVKHSLMVE